MRMKIKWKPLIISLLISLGTGILSGIVVYNSMDQYETLYQPPLAPPGWVFPIVWTILFTLMGIAAYRIYISNSTKRTEALKLYGMQLIVNAGWSIIFFGFQSYFIAFICLLLLWYLILSTLVQFYKIDKPAGILFIPYLLWVTFAGYLNLAIAFYYF